MKLPLLIGMTSLSLLLAGSTLAQEQEIVCPHAKGWTPTKQELQRILSDHRQLALKTWKEREENERTNVGRYGGYDWQSILEILRRGGPLFETELWGAWAKRPSGAANFCNANLDQAELDNAILDWANFNNADLSSAKLTHAKLRYAELRRVTLKRAQLNGADLSWANLDNANLTLANLDNATLSSAVLAEAKLIATSVAGARFSWADLSKAYYLPRSQPPDSHVAGIQGLETVYSFPGEEGGLVQLRELIQKAGLRDLERKATFAIEYHKTRSALDEVGGIAEYVFRMVAFEWTTGYGLYPGRALKIIAVIWLLLSLIYFWPIRFEPKGSSTGGIYQVWPSDRIEANDGAVTLNHSANVSRLNRDHNGAAFGYAAYFSLLSAFHIGWRDLNVGTWIARIQPREYSLRAVGWVRVVSGIQSLLSVYLVALWALTYFGRPFQ